MYHCLYHPASPRRANSLEHGARQKSAQSLTLFFPPRFPGSGSAKTGHFSCASANKGAACPHDQLYHLMYQPMPPTGDLAVGRCVYQAAFGDLHKDWQAAGIDEGPLRTSGRGGRAYEEIHMFEKAPLCQETPQYGRSATSLLLLAADIGTSINVRTAAICSQVQLRVTGPSMAAAAICSGFKLG